MAKTYGTVELSGLRTFVMRWIVGGENKGKKNELSFRRGVWRHNKEMDDLHVAHP